MDKKQISNWFQQLQNNICNSLEELDGKARFQEDLWERNGGGGGKTRVIRNGNLIAKGGVNFSAVHGQTPEKILQALKLEPSEFFATGVSIVLHSENPWVPIIHMNVRYFEMSNGIWWFGGGIDLTPHYIFKENASNFHQILKSACDKHHPEYYTQFKKWADDYFYIKHRNETRGIGGIFFDRLSDKDNFTKSQRWEFVQEIGNSFIPSYKAGIKGLVDKKYDDTNKNWQKLRRGRYVEFNLVYDKGTKFGLDTDGRTESILMSLPPQANWEYEYKAQHENEKNTLALLKKDIDWVNA